MIPDTPDSSVYTLPEVKERPCERCGAPMPLPTRRPARKRFCGRFCRYQWHNEQRKQERAFLVARVGNVQEAIRDVLETLATLDAATVELGKALTGHSR